MRTELLDADLTELAGEGIGVEQAMRRALAELGRRHVAAKLRQAEGSEAGVAELLHRCAETQADLLMTRYALATRAAHYRASRLHYELVDEDMAGLRRDVVPRLRRELQAAVEREQALEQELRAVGVEPAAIGPHVPAGAAISTRLAPGEGPGPERSLPLRAPLAPRRPLRRRLRDGDDLAQPLLLAAAALLVAALLGHLAASGANRLWLALLALAVVPLAAALVLRRGARRGGGETGGPG